MNMEFDKINELVDQLSGPLMFENANDAFVILHYLANKTGTQSAELKTRALYNVGFYVQQPLNNIVGVEWRKWNPKYAEREWQWYLSGNRSVKELKKFAPMWNEMHGGDDIVNSNYGYHWRRNEQLVKVINQIREKPLTRQAWLTIFDGKEKHLFEHDTPCTLSIGFRIIHGELCMNVHMRSNDLWYGFCNDQYCFSKIQQMVAKELKVPIGWYYHFAADLHIYEKHYLENLKIKNNEV